MALSATYAPQNADVGVSVVDVMLMETVTPNTREVLMDTAELLFAERGVQGTPTREIVEAAGQRNASAVTYHFGSRENLLLEILARRGGPVDLERGVLRATLDSSPPTDDLMACLVVPYLSLLDSPGGRAYLRIVAQLRGRFAGWRGDSDEATTANLGSILVELESRTPGWPADLRAEADREANGVSNEQLVETRMVAMIMLLTGLTAQRAQLIDRGNPPSLPLGSFTEVLVEMCTSLIEGRSLPTGG